jgi:hypothetical protein
MKCQNVKVKKCKYLKRIKRELHLLVDIFYLACNVYTVQSAVLVHTAIDIIPDPATSSTFGLSDIDHILDPGPFFLKY